MLHAKLARGTLKGVALVMFGACGSARLPPPAAASASGEAPVTPVVAVQSPAAPSAGRALLERALGWANGARLDEATYNARFSPEFVAQVPYAKVSSIVASLQGERPWEEASVEETVKLVAHWTRGTQKLRVTLVPDAGGSSRIASLLLGPDVAEPAGGAARPMSATAAVEKLEGMGKLSLLVASTTSGKCEPLLQVAPALSQPVGSAFKLWVLAAVVKKVRAGELHWTDPVKIQDGLDSLPSGVTQDDPDGSTRTLRELAERMIAISDNTATDHLIAHVGRAAVEKAVAESGHAHPELNRPFLSTREMVILKLGADEILQKDYIAANEAGRRKLLETRVRAAPLPPLREAEQRLAMGPSLIHEIEWQGSTLDLCRQLVALTKDEAASKILALNPGIPAPAGRWSYIGYKGGSEPGVLTMAWEHEAPSGERFVTVAELSNDKAALPEAEVVPLMAAIRDDAQHVASSAAPGAGGSMPQQR